jgi:CubicO group peptidase (beta-lactamase class C family)
VQTRFRIASLTKSITATAIMRLRERGKLDLQDSVCKYLDICPEAWRAITLHHLLSNSSGIPNHFWGTEPDRQAAATREQVLARMSDKSLEFAPGTRFNYGNASWYLLGIVIERITGLPYDQALQELIFGPLGMKDTGRDDREQLVERRADGYIYNAGRRQNARYEDVSWVVGAASLYSTVEDIYKFDRALDGHALLSAGGRTLMWTSLDLASDNGKIQYGYGWWILPKGGAIERTAIRGSGGMAGFMSQQSRYPHEGVTIIVLENTIGGPNVQPEIEKRVFGAGN